MATTNTIRSWRMTKMTAMMTRRKRMFTDYLKNIGNTAVDDGPVYL